MEAVHEKRFSLFRNLLYLCSSFQLPKMYANEIILLALAVLPVVVLAFYVYRQDRYEKEPMGMLVKAFLFGCLSVLPAVFLEQGLMTLYSNSGGASLPGALHGVYEGFVVAGCSEELSKLLLLTLAVWRSREFNEYFDGIVYAAFVSLGFAGLENIMYVFSQETVATAVATGSMRALLSVPGHFLFGVVMGYYFALAKFEPEHRSANLFKAFLYPMLLHGSFDALLMIPEGMGEGYEWLAGILFPLFIYFDIRLWKIGMRRLRHLQELSAQQAEDSAEGPAEGYDGEPEDPFKGFDWNV